MKTKKKSEARFAVRVIGLDSVVFERVRASLRGGPFHFFRADDSPPADGEPDLSIVRAQDLEDLGRRSSPVIACGPASLLRSAFLGGCADYLREPWVPEELEMRALAVLSRERRRFEFSWGAVSFEGKDLRAPRGLVELTHHESKILLMLPRARGEPIPRSALVYELGGRPGRTSRSVDVHVASLRRKVRRVEKEAGRFIMCIRGEGYMIP